MANNNRSDLNRSGRYIQGGISDSLSNSIGWWERRILPKASTDVPITLNARYHKRPDLLAFDLYGKASWGWLILQFNNIVDINVEFIQGKKILVPTKQRVTQELMSTPITFLNK